MKALALIEAPQHVCYRYRLEAYLPELSRRGLTLEALPIPAGLPARIKHLRRAAPADVVILQRKLLPLWQLALLRRSAQTLVYDFDDAMFHRDSFAPKGIRSRSRMMHFWATIYASDAVLAGNDFLGQQAARFVGHERVTVIPTCVCPATYPLSQHASDGRAVRLVWIGQPSTMRALRQFQPHLTAASNRVAGLELRVICSEFPKLDGIRVVPRTWSQEGEAAELAECDIGISWLPVDPWSQGKCGLKVLQYLAAGLPVVANPVGMHCELVRPGKTGFLATTPQEWADAIDRLAADPDLRRQMGAAGRRLVETHYSVDRWAPLFASVLEKAVGRRNQLDRPPSVNAAGLAAILGGLQQVAALHGSDGGQLW